MTDNSRITRAMFKRMGGKLIASRRCAEVEEQVWQLPDGSLWGGTDWYHDARALLWPGEPEWHKTLPEPAP